MRNVFLEADEEDLIMAIRNYNKSYPNGSANQEFYIQMLLSELMETTYHINPKANCIMNENVAIMEKRETMRSQLSDILVAVSWSDISRTYFGKSNSWLYHKLNGIDGNKKPTEFSYEEKLQLKGALSDLASRIRRASDSIEV